MMKVLLMVAQKPISVLTLTPLTYTEALLKDKSAPDDHSNSLSGLTVTARSPWRFS